jgi:hypothetical protein
MKPEETPAKVPAMDKQAGKDPWLCYESEPGVWSKRMLAALDKEVKGNKWFSLIDKVYADRTLELRFPRISGQAGRRPVRKDSNHAKNTRKLRQRLPSGSR